MKQSGAPQITINSSMFVGAITRSCEYRAETALIALLGIPLHMSERRSHPPGVWRFRREVPDASEIQPRERRVELQRGCGGNGLLGIHFSSTLAQKQATTVDLKWPPSEFVRRLKMIEAGIEYAKHRGY